MGKTQIVQWLFFKPFLVKKFEMWQKVQKQDAVQNIKNEYVRIIQQKTKERLLKLGDTPGSCMVSLSYLFLNTIQCKYKYRSTVPLKRRHEKSTGRLKVASAAAVVTA